MFFSSFQIPGRICERLKAYDNQPPLVAPRTAGLNRRISIQKLVWSTSAHTHILSYKREGFDLYPDTPYWLECTPSLNSLVVPPLADPGTKPSATTSSVWLAFYNCSCLCSWAQSNDWMNECMNEWKSLLCRTKGQKWHLSLTQVSMELMDEWREQREGGEEGTEQRKS